MKLLVATGNPGKLKEIRSLLDPSPLEIIGLDQLTDPPEVIEDGSTFADNARKKAQAMAQFSGYLTFAHPVELLPSGGVFGAGNRT